MITISDENKQISQCILCIQRDIGAIERRGRNTHFNNRYMLFDDLIARVKSVAAKLDCMVLQSGSAHSIDGVTGKLVYTQIRHVDGEWIQNEVFLPFAKKDPQAAGTCLTYGKRYGLAALLAVCDQEDDDGNAASGDDDGNSAPNRSSRETAKDPGRKFPMLSKADRAAVIDAFGEQGVSTKELEDAVGVPCSEWDENTRRNLRPLMQKLKKGVSWEEITRLP